MKRIKKIDRMAILPVSEMHSESTITEQGVWDLVDKINEIIDVLNSLQTKKDEK